MRGNRCTRAESSKFDPSVRSALGAPSLASLSMPVPDYETLMLSVLREAAKGETSVPQLRGPVAAEFQLTPAELEERIPSGHLTLLSSRLHWAKTYLRNAGLVASPRRGVIVATERGRAVVKKPPPRIDLAFLRKFPEFLAFETRSRPGGGTTKAPEATPVPKTPDEQIDAAHAIMTTELRGEILRRIVAADASFLERVIIDLLLAMGYGDSAAGAGLHLGRTGDGGIDGVIKQNPLGLEVVYVQAKRYQPGNVVGEEALRGFSGALTGHGATRGVFVTTSRFSEPARRYVRTVLQQKIVLLDGEEFAELLVRHGVGARTERTVELKTLDAGYFEDEEDDEGAAGPPPATAT